MRFIAAFHHGKTINNKRRKRHQSHLANHDANHINAFGIANYNGNNQSNFADHGSKTHQYKTHQYYLVKLRLKTQQRHLAKKQHKSLTLPKTSLFTAFYSQNLCFANSTPSSLPSNFLKIFKNFLKVFKTFSGKTSDPSSANVPTSSRRDQNVLAVYSIVLHCSAASYHRPGTRNTLRRWPLARWAQPHNTLFKTFIAIRQQCLTCRHTRI